jgi:hypothetical protein
MKTFFYYIWGMGFNCNFCFISCIVFVWVYMGEYSRCGGHTVRHSTHFAFCIIDIHCFSQYKTAGSLYKNILINCVVIVFFNHCKYYSQRLKSFGEQFCMYNYGLVLWSDKCACRRSQNGAISEGQKKLNPIRKFYYSVI